MTEVGPTNVTPTAHQPAPRGSSGTAPQHRPLPKDVPGLKARWIAVARHLRDGFVWGLCGGVALVVLGPVVAFAAPVFRVLGFLTGEGEAPDPDWLHTLASWHLSAIGVRLWVGLLFGLVAGAESARKSWKASAPARPVTSRSVVRATRRAWPVGKSDLLSRKWITFWTALAWLFGIALFSNALHRIPTAHDAAGGLTGWSMLSVIAVGASIAFVAWIGLDALARRLRAR